MDKVQSKIENFSPEVQKDVVVPLTPIASSGQKNNLVKKQSLSRKSSVPVVPQGKGGENSNIPASTGRVGNKSVLDPNASTINLPNSPNPVPSSNPKPTQNPTPTEDVICIGDIKPTPSEKLKADKNGLPESFYFHEREGYNSRRHKEYVEKYSEEDDEERLRKFEEKVKVSAGVEGKEDY